MKRERMNELFEAFTGKTVIVIGDYILDQYMIGDTGRVSREAPVVVVNYKKSVYHPGGAANAARNVVSLGGAALAVGVVGNDPEGKTLSSLLQDKGVGVGGLVSSDAIDTALKIRIMSGDLHAQKQQVARVDRLYQLKAGDAVFGALMEFVENSLAKSDVVLISDYGMGVVPGTLSERAIALCRERKIPVVVDSRYCLLRYPGANLATPNEVEALSALGLDLDSPGRIEDTARELVEKARLDGIIITRGNCGMFVRSPDGGGHTIGIIGSNEATDVTGAGDTVAATTALTIAAGGTFKEAAEMATRTAAIVVMKRGTAEVSPEEVRSLVETHAIA